MKGFVLDASITLSWCFCDESTPQALALLDLLSKETAIVPSIWSLEIGNILVGAERKKRITYADVVEFISLLKNLNIQIDEASVDRNFHEILLLAHSEGLTTYDASYLELAMRLGLPLATKDKVLSEAAIRLGVKLL